MSILCYFGFHNFKAVGTSVARLFHYDLFGKEMPLGNETVVYRKCQREGCALVSSTTLPGIIPVEAVLSGAVDPEIAELRKISGLGEALPQNCSYPLVFATNRNSASKLTFR